ncbi:uncharacterized protein LOC110689905 [Chenopodium quinoa]|uniref:uncharacterized protein LOC110689905 n=1 Tax=Chenopodium quinoa TaxID=63459 RepID=UPI000B773CEC|nr:uncharacterized protein LOC110689905 [Chenopodium quinoa]
MTGIIGYPIISIRLQNGNGVYKGKEKVGDEAGPSVVKPPCWRPPKPGFLKLNTDGAWVSTDLGGGGGVFRIIKGEWEGLNYARAMPLQYLEVETNAEAIRSLLNKKGDHMHHELAAVIIDVARLLNNREMNVILSTVPRGLNSLAHYLAKYAMDMAMGHTDHFV